MSFKAYVIANHKVDLFLKGLNAAGYLATTNYPPDKIKSGDILLAWNRKESTDKMIAQFEKAGGKVFIAENGYIGKDNQGNRLISLALSKHLGLGKWPVFYEQRFLSHNFEIQEWKSGGDEIVILGQRGIGLASSGYDWPYAVYHELKHKTKRPIKIREHPGKNPETSLEDALKNAHCVVTYSSSAGIQAIAQGIPCFHMLKGWIGQDASIYGIDNLESPFKGDRMPMFHKLSWAQWTQEEIATGEAFRCFSTLL